MQTRFRGRSRLCRMRQGTGHPARSLVSKRSLQVMGDLWLVLVCPLLSSLPSSPSPCGKNTHCSFDHVKNEVVCACLPGYDRGDPLSPAGCSPECSKDADCGPDLACVNLHCVNTCPGSCGIGAQCKLINHRWVNHEHSDGFSCLVQYVQARSS